ncbi:MnhB domain-containing protein [Nitrincola nitratireducens]|uniref:Multiple resistance and pH homeostasis protein A n=1 Tax=Nitrincola nitratireducens TaxID=1229521 RepID=W9US98_9GAMM|nr:MnhB domain-containing protein [Nitrincola nitratireducens]EXJ10108.1 Multiple resistance and pH homeostasis protein A [Nitrincola nitratireducens]
MNELIDLTLVCILLGLASLSLFTQSLFRAVMFFILLGLILALVWIRLDAPDIALAEAAIGAGITGILLLDALAHLRATSNTPPQLQQLKQPRFWLALISGAGVILLLALAISEPLAPAVALDLQVSENLTNSGVTHPITAILLNFRSYDTLLEVAVLVLAALVAVTLRQSDEHPVVNEYLPNPLLHACLKLFFPMIFLVSMYLLWAGAAQPGGAFQAGAVLAAAFVLFYLVGLKTQLAQNDIYLKGGWIFGLALFVLVGSMPLLYGQPFLTYPDSQAGIFILLIELGLTLSIGWILFSMFLLSQSSPLQKKDSP